MCDITTLLCWQVYQRNNIHPEGHIDFGDVVKKVSKRNRQLSYTCISSLPDFSCPLYWACRTPCILPTSETGDCTERPYGEFGGHVHVMLRALTRFRKARVYCRSVPRQRHCSDRSCTRTVMFSCFMRLGLRARSHCRTEKSDSPYDVAIQFSFSHSAVASREELQRESLCRLLIDLSTAEALTKVRIDTITRLTCQWHK